MADNSINAKDGDRTGSGTDELIRIPVDQARQVAIDILLKFGAPNEHAELQADVLIDAELTGASSHGLLRLERIIERAVNRVADFAVRGKHQWTADAFLTVDGQRGLGPVVLNFALDAAMERVNSAGIAGIGISNSNHIGKLGWYAHRVAERGLILVLLSTSEALVHPWGGRTALLGTNPIAIGVPTSDGPFVIDLATSLVSMGKIHDFANRNQPLPDGWAVDAQGVPTTDAHAAKAGAIAPFGGGKGYALGLAFEMLVAALTSSAIGPDVRGTLDSTEICNKGDVAFVVDPRVSPVGANLARYLHMIRSSPPAPDFEQVLAPGDRAQTNRTEVMRTGIPMPGNIWRRLNDLRSQNKPRTT